MSRRVRRRAGAALGAAVVAVATAEALSGPYWWNARGVVDTNAPPGDFSPANQGQAKWMATQGAAEFDAYLPGGSGAAVSNLLAGFSTTNNWLPLNLGQLKTLATPFYDRLAEAGITGALPPGVTGAYPWTTEAGDDADFAMANLGQLKFVFSFDLDRPLSVDRDEDGLPDWWEIEYWSSLEESGNEDDPDEDGYLNEDEYAAGTDPTDADSHPWDVSGLVTYSGGQTGVIYVVGLDAAGAVVASTVADAAGYYRMCRLPVGGEYDIRAFMDSDCTTTQDFGEAWAQWPTTLVLTQDVADVDLELADPDTDGDGLPDYWEVLYGLDPLNGGAADACAWWKLDETSGTNVFDSCDGANTGTVQNATAPAWTNGVIGGALFFDGVDDVVTVPDGDWLNPSFVTVSLWLRAEAAPTNVAFVSKKEPGAASGYEVSYTNGQLRFVVGATSEKALLASCTLTNGGWYHVAGVYGGATQSLYLNGVRVALTNYSLGTATGEMGVSTNALTLGARGSGAAQPFAGRLDDVRIYASVLSSNEVVAIWQVGQDVDGDGLGALMEYEAGSSPEDQDTDGDGTSDYTEAVINHTDPADPDTSPPSVWIYEPADGARRVLLP